MDLTPPLILSMWVGGIAAGGALVATWRVVGPGYLWLTGAVVAGVGAVAALAGGGAVAIVGTVLGLIAIVVARWPVPTAVVLGGAALAFAIAAVTDSPVAPVVTGTILFGGVTSEMMLGHWYLVDPRLPRRPLHRLDAIAFAGLVGDVALVAFTGSITFAGADGVFGMAYVALAAFTALLLVGVWLSLKEPRYSGVMAATGLSYLAVLTTFGVVTLGRVLVTGGLT